MTRFTTTALAALCLSALIGLPALAERPSVNQLNAAVNQLEAEVGQLELENQAQQAEIDKLNAEAESFVVRDVAGAPVGRFLEFVNSNSSGLDRAYVVMDVQVNAEQRTIIVEVSSTAFYSGSDGTTDNAWSLAEGCSEPIYKPNAMRLGIEQAFVANEIAYISQGGAVPENIITRSRLNFDGTCNNTGPTEARSVIRSEALDLGARFSPPFALGF